MLLLGHTGVTLGLAWFAESLLDKWWNIAKPKQEATQPGFAYAADPPDCPGGHKLSGKLSLDYRLVLLGSMLPDLIDKPIGIFLLGHVFSNGRIFAHTAVFTVSLLVAGAMFYRRRAGPSLLTLGYGSFMHLVLDGMWADLNTLFWPLQGWAFAKGDISHWLLRMLFAVTHDSRAYISEALGAAILVTFLFTLLRRQRAWQWLKTGQLG